MPDHRSTGCAPAAAAATRVPYEVWRALERRHVAAVDERLAGHLERRRGGIAHPVEDFLFTYYRLRPGALRRWHPGLGAALELGPDAAATGATPAVTERASWRWYRTQDHALDVDLVALQRDRGTAARLVHDVLAGTASRPASYSCFGLHEWAMVYEVPEGAQRHESWPLRLGAAGTDEVVRSHPITCTHFDAFRFFTPAARPLNRVQPTRELAPGLEQPGCLHAGMDLYRHAYGLGPAVPGELLLACFDLARDIRILDMQASPYDLRELGYAAVAVETAQGRATYARRQRELSARADPLRAQLIGVAAQVAGRT